MEPKSLPSWVKYVGYPAFFILAFLIFFELTLPYRAMQARATRAAREAGYTLTVGSLGPGFLGVRARDVLLSVLPAAGTKPATPPPTVKIDSVSARPGLFPPGVHLSAKAFGGAIAAFLAPKAKGFARVELDASQIDLERAGLKVLAGVNLKGTADLEGKLVLNPALLSQTTGTVKLLGKDVVLSGGEGLLAMLPKAALGAIDVQLKAEGGKATLSKLSVNGTDLDAVGEGDVTLNNRFDASQMKLKLQFRPADAWLKNPNNSFIQMGLHAGGRADPRGYYTAHVDGMVGNPRANLRAD